VIAKLKQLELPLNLPLSQFQKKDLFSCKNSCIYHSIDLHNIFSKSSSNIFTFIDLFAGIGGFRIAFENLGGKCVFSSEIDKYSRQTYQANFNDIPEGDITLIPASQIPDHDILTAGFPCQAFSIAGRREGFEDSRGTLFFEIARIIKEKKPKAFFLENVKGLVSHDKGKTISILFRSLKSLMLKILVFHKIEKEYLLLVFVTI
jgi:DNA (cytosine-5)-methyltransferase 1